MNNPVILVSNDDGVHSPGLHCLAEALKALGDVTVVAPDRERNAASHALTLHKPLRVEEVRSRVFSVNGTPTDCVNLGVLHLLKGKPPDLVVSGINKGANLGDDVTYSGTVSAAMEGTLLGIPSLAFSQPDLDRALHTQGKYHFETAARFALRLARLVLERGLEKGRFLNVNVPNCPSEDIQGVRVTSLGKRVFDEGAIHEQTDPRGRKYYWIGLNGMTWEEGRKNTDQAALAHGIISVTPLHLDLTDYRALDTLSSWAEELRDSEH
ncbi:MAG: 5'/3'-nucleotidase SurE [Nitrospira sp.]|nr:5'/3'-nucleotidase SurE [Candidatus Manganitrophaceae bacterium]HIL35004.1 5'/3'-nucleotidase SurE [Candidatus Manganitrophaceae bacterium]